jgi:hypothetical protein
VQVGILGSAIDTRRHALASAAQRTGDELRPDLGSNSINRQSLRASITTSCGINARDVSSIALGGNRAIER